MRPDFKHLLTERERHNSRWDSATKGQKRLQQKDESNVYEEWTPGTKIGIKKHYTGKSFKSKMLNENLTPLKNFLRESVGRVWDEVFAEISEACPDDSAVSGHIYDHLWGYVERSPQIRENGDVFGSRAYRTETPLYSTEKYPQLYVDPESGVLKECPRKPRQVSWKKKELAERLCYERKLSNGDFVVKVDGIWFKADLRSFPQPRLREPDDKHFDFWYEPVSYQDVYYSSTVTSKKDRSRSYMPWYGSSWEQTLTHYYGEPVYCHSLKQLNSTELRRHNLKND